jgi:hypothetical protein
MRQENMVMGPAGPETKNDCAGEGQQQITGLDLATLSVAQSMQQRMIGRW